MKSPDLSQKEAPDHYSRGLLFGLNGYEMATNFCGPKMSESEGQRVFGIRQVAHLAVAR
jgi:hypothetical protein